VTCARSTVHHRAVAITGVAVRPGSCATMALGLVALGNQGAEDRLDPVYASWGVEA
jgi:hypothetical protein